MNKDIEYAIYKLNSDSLSYEELIRLVQLQKEHIKALEGQIKFMNRVIKSSKR